MPEHLPFGRAGWSPDGGRRCDDRVVGNLVHGDELGLAGHDRGCAQHAAVIGPAASPRRKDRSAGDRRLDIASMVRMRFIGPSSSDAT